MGSWGAVCCSDLLPESGPHSAWHGWGIGDRQRRRLGYTACDLERGTEDDKVAVTRASRGSDQDPLVAVTVELITDGLERWPLVGGGPRWRQTDSAQTLLVIEQRDILKFHAPPP